MTYCRTLQIVTDMHHVDHTEVTFIPFCGKAALLPMFGFGKKT